MIVGLVEVCSGFENSLSHSERMPPTARRFQSFVRGTGMEILGGSTRLRDVQPLFKNSFNTFDYGKGVTPIINQFTLVSYLLDDKQVGYK